MRKTLNTIILGANLLFMGCHSIERKQQEQRKQTYDIPEIPYETQEERGRYKNEKMLMHNQKIPVFNRTLKGAVCLGFWIPKIHHTLKCVVFQESWYNKLEKEYLLYIA